MADIDVVLDRMSRDEVFRDRVRSDPRSALDGQSLSTDDLARVQDALGTPPGGPSVEALFTEGASGAGRAGLIGLLLPALAVLGLVVGFTGGAVGLAGGSTRTFMAPLSPVAVSDCPGGSPVGNLHRGDRVLVTGRDESGDFLQIRDPAHLQRLVWVAASAVVETTGPTSDVPVPAVLPACKGDIASAGTSGDAPGAPTTTVAGATTLPPESTTTTAAGSTTTSAAPTTTTTPSPTTTAPAPSTTAGETTPPTISGTNASPTEIWESYSPAGGLCSTQTTTVVSTKITDASGVGSASLSWSVGASNGSTPMSLSGGSYRATLGPFPYPTVPDGTVGSITVTVNATDTRGNTSSASITVPLHSASECIG